MSYILAKNLCLEFPIYNARKLSLRNSIVDKLGGSLRKEASKVSVVRALNNINLEVNPGDRVGLIGHNGSGKSTLLRTIAGIYHPTEGSLETKGKISTLFGTAVGLNEEMTGYENLFLNALIFNANYKKTKANMKALAEFTDLGNYLDLPMRTYSEGMKVRIGFSAATTNIVPEILLIDEVFGAGDRDFATKSNARMLELISNSNILIFASHGEGLLKSFCNKGILMEKGEIVEYGDIDTIFKIYHKRHP